MRAFFSYGVAFVIILGITAWLSTGTLIQGGQGPGNGEQPLISAIEGREDGPLKHSLEGAGLLAEHEELEGSVDPHLTIAERVAQANGGEGNLVSVRIKSYTAQAMPIEVPLRGNTKAKATVSAVAETTGTVETVHVTKGQTVKTGDLLCTLDKGTRESALLQAQASVAQAEASQIQAQADLDTNAELRAKGLAAANTARPLEVALTSAQASLRAAQAGLESAQEEIGRVEVYAKSNGTVQAPLADVGSMLAAGSPCATIVQLDPILFTGNVPEARIALAKLGLDAKITTITGATATGKVTYIASTADAATRSFPIEIEIANADGKILDGVTAEAVVNLGTAPAHLLPQSVLTLDDSGAMGVRAVEDSKVAFYPVTIVQDTREGVWVTGLPLTVDVITLGQENVTTGQTVNAATVDETDDTTEEGTPS